VAQRCHLTNSRVGPMSDRPSRKPIAESILSDDRVRRRVVGQGRPREALKRRGKNP
jgi:hypothetical protein